MPLDRTPQLQNVYNPTLSGMQKVAIASTSTASSAIIGADAILLIATQDCYIVFAASPTATSAGFYIPKNVPIAIACDPTLKIAVIRDTADGNLFVTPLN